MLHSNVTLFTFLVQFANETYFLTVSKQESDGEHVLAEPLDRSASFFSKQRACSWNWCEQINLLNTKLCNPKDIYKWVDCWLY